MVQKEGPKKVFFLWFFRVPSQHGLQGVPGEAPRLKSTSKWRPRHGFSMILGSCFHVILETLWKYFLCSMTYKLIVLDVQFTVVFAQAWGENLRWFLLHDSSSMTPPPRLHGHGMWTEGYSLAALLYQFILQWWMCHLLENTISFVVCLQIFFVGLTPLTTAFEVERSQISSCKCRGSVTTCILIPRSRSPKDARRLFLVSSSIVWIWFCLQLLGAQPVTSRFYFLGCLQEVLGYLDW